MNRRRFFIAAGAMVATSLLDLFPRLYAVAAEAGSKAEGDLRRLTEPGGGDNRATFMPDGKTLLFASARSGKSQIWQMDSDGAHSRRFHTSAANDYGRVAPNSDGTRICFSSDRDGQNAVYVLDLATGHVAVVSDPAFWSFGPTWSSRDLIAFFSKKGGNKINVWTVRPDGSGARQVTDQPGESRQPWWSPDGATMALSADHGTSAFQVWLLNPDGSNARPITSHGTFEQPFWSPDGRRIAVSASIDEARRRIYIMDADGSNLRPIRQPEAENVHPAWSPEGRSIVFTSGKGDEGSIYISDVA